MISFWFKQKRKVQEESGTTPDVPVDQPKLKVVRQFRQKTPVADSVTQKKPSLSRDLLSGVSIVLSLRNHIIYLIVTACLPATSFAGIW